MAEYVKSGKGAVHLRGHYIPPNESDIDGEMWTVCGRDTFNNFTTDRNMATCKACLRAVHKANQRAKANG